MPIFLEFDERYPRLLAGGSQESERGLRHEKFWGHI
jgi:hypothetical protein